MNNKSPRFNRLQIEWKPLFSPTEQSIIDQLLFRSNLEGYTKFYVKKIALETNIDRKTVSRTFNKFNAFISKVGDSHFTFDYAKFLQWLIDNAPAENSPEGGVKIPTGGEEKGTGGEENSPEGWGKRDTISNSKSIITSNSKEVIEESNRVIENTELNNRKVLGNQTVESNSFHLDSTACGSYNNLEDDLLSGSVSIMQGHLLTSKEKEIIHKAFQIACGKVGTVNGPCGHSASAIASLTSTMPAASSENMDNGECVLVDVGNASTAPAGKWVFSFSKNKPSPPSSMYSSAENSIPPLPKLPKRRNPVYSQSSLECDIGAYVTPPAIFTLPTNQNATLTHS